MDNCYKDNFQELLANSFKKLTSFVYKTEQNYEIEEESEEDAIIPDEYYHGKDF